MANAAVEAAGPVVEKFAGSAGRWLGYFGVAICLVGIAAVVIDGSSAWRGALVAAAIALVSWAVLVRPTVAIHQNGVLMRNIAHDAFIPSSKIEKCRTAQTLMIRADDQTFHGLGVGKSARSVMREQRPAGSGFQGFQSMMGSFGPSAASKLDDNTPVHRFANEEQTGGSYADYVSSRIEQLRTKVRDDERVPIQAVAWEPIVGLVLAGCLVLVSIFA